MKPEKAFYPWMAATILIMAAIFMFSAQTAVVSGGISNSMTRTVIEALWRWLAPGGAGATEPFIEAAETLLRKCAHFSIYFALGFCAAHAMKRSPLLKRASRTLLSGSVLCSLYAATDELHQHFVPGRAGMWQDWLLDTAGSVLGIGIVMLLAERKRRKTTRQAPDHEPRQ